MAPNHIKPYKRLHLHSRTLSTTGRGEKANLTGADYGPTDMDDVREDQRMITVKGSKLLPYILQRVSRIVDAIVPACKHGDIRILDDKTVVLRADYLHPNLVAATRFRKDDYSPDIRNPELDRIFETEFPIRVRRHLVNCLIEQGIVGSKETGDRLFDAIVYVTRVIIAETLGEEELVEQLQKQIEGQITEEPRIYYDNLRDFKREDVTARIFTSRQEMAGQGLLEGPSDQSLKGRSETDEEFTTDPSIASEESRRQGSEAA